MTTRDTVNFRMRLSIFTLSLLVIDALCIASMAGTVCRYLGVIR
jgi:hypothetical protein